MSSMVALRRWAGKPRAERCTLCALPLADVHEHLVRLDEHRIECACTACAILFERESAPQFRRVGRDVRRLPELDQAAWRMLGLPVELAFVIVWSSGGVTAVLPSALGAVDHLVPLEAWTALASAHPMVARLRSDIEALLVDGRSARAWIVPIDRAYALVGQMRQGGPEAVATFLARLDGNA